MTDRRVPLSHTGAASTDPTGSAGEPATAAPVRGVNAAPPSRPPSTVPPAAAGPHPHWKGTPPRGGRHMDKGHMTGWTLMAEGGLYPRPRWPRYINQSRADLRLQQQQQIWERILVRSLPSYQEQLFQFLFHFVALKDPHRRSVTDVSTLST